MAAVESAPGPGAPRRGALAALRDGYRRALEVVVIVLMVALFLEVTTGVVFRGPLVGPRRVFRSARR